MCTTNSSPSLHVLALGPDANKRIEAKPEQQAAQQHSMVFYIPLAQGQKRLQL
eukprot:m.56850 g.56850  ORF g.56850 m.56850 type:complete len:53 (-) comp12674_c0_seq2:1254-1412(-)